MDGETYRLVLTESSPLLMRGLVEVLQDTDDLNVVATAPDAEIGYQVVLRQRPDLVVVNMMLGGRGAFTLADEISNRLPNSRVVFLGHFFSDSLLHLALRVNVTGFFLTDESSDQIVAGLRKSAQGETVCSAELAERLETDKQTGSIRAKYYGRLSELTTRELTVLQLIACGRRPAEIAEALSLSRRTVESQKSKIMKKLDIHDRVELALYAVGEGLGFPLRR